MELTRTRTFSPGSLGWLTRAGAYFGDVLRLGLRIMFHPFDGFYDLKFEGKWGAIPILLVFTLLVRMGSLSWSSFHFSELDPEDTSFFLELIKIMAPWLTWCIASYAVSSIAYGEGTFKQIVIASAYCLMPYILFNLPLVVVFSHILSRDEKAMYYFLFAVIQCWVGLLFFIQVWSIHNFTFGRALGITALTLISILVIWVLLGLVFVLTNQMVQFFAELGYEFTTRN